MKMIDYYSEEAIHMYKSVDFSSLYKMYLTGNYPKVNSFEVVEELSESYNKNEIKSLADEPTLRPVYEVFPLSFFNGSTMYETVTGKYGKYDYTRESSSFVGTTNILTYFVGMYKTSYFNYSTQEFYADYVLDYNDAVVYNPDANDIFVWSWVDNPGSVSSPTVTIKCNNANGCIIRREQYAYVGENFANKIVRAIINWVPYLSTGTASVETLTSKEANEIQTYGSNLTDQVKRYGKRIDEITVEGARLGSSKDHVYLSVTGYNITSASATFSCKVTF